MTLDEQFATFLAKDPTVDPTAYVAAGATLLGDVRIGPQASGGPYYSPVRGAFTRSGVRFLRSQIRVGGMIYDQYNEWDSWIQTGAQF